MEQIEQEKPQKVLPDKTRERPWDMQGFLQIAELKPKLPWPSQTWGSTQNQVPMLSSGLFGDNYSNFVLPGQSLGTFPLQLLDLP